MKLTTVAEAIATIERLVHPVTDTELVPVARADGRIVAKSVYAAWDLPSADVSIMDGWAVRSADLVGAGGEVTLRVVGESAAGHPAAGSLAPGTTVRISTGAVIVDGADAVVAQEDTRREDDRVVVDAAAARATSPGRFVRARGREIGQGQLLAIAGQRIMPGDLALLAGAGLEDVPVYRIPRVAILSTGDELVPVGVVPRPGQVVSSNGLMLAAMVRDAGGDPWVMRDVVDDPAKIEAALRRAMDADLVVTCGGVSVGDHDHVHEVLDELGADLHVRGVALRPGKPTTIATRGATLCVLLPGNPASSFVAFELFVRPALHRRAGRRDDIGRPRRRVTLAAPARGTPGRSHYVRARFVGPDRVAPLEVQQSGNLRSIAAVDALVVVEPGVTEIPAEATAEAVILRDPAARR